MNTSRRTMASTQSHNLLAEVDQALEQAIAALRNKQKEYPIHSGKAIDEQKRPYRYQFTLEKAWAVEEGAELSLKGPGLSDYVKVRLAHMEDEVTIVLETNSHLPPETLPQAVLIEDPTFLLVKLREALASLEDVGLGLTVVGQQSSIDGEQPFHPFTCPDLHLEPAQAQAVRRSLGSELLMLLGPPGTGKTFVLAAIAFFHMLAGRRVLITSHTNIAIDNAIQRLVELLRLEGEEARIEQQQVIRQGTPRLPELEENAFSNVTLPLIVSHEQQTLQQQYAALEAHQEQLRASVAKAEAVVTRARAHWNQEYAEYRRDWQNCQERLVAARLQEQQRLQAWQTKLQRGLEKQTQVAARVRAAKLELDKADQQLEDFARQLHNLTKSKNQYQTQIADQEHWPRWRQWLLPRLKRSESLSELRGRLAAAERMEQAVWMQRQSYSATTWYRCQDEYQKARKQEQQSLEQLEEIRSQERLVNPELVRLIAQETALSQNIHEGEQKQREWEGKLGVLHQEYDRVTRQLSALDEELLSLVKRTEQRIVGKAQVVGATLTSLALNRHLFPFGEWDVVVIDEASMAAPAAVLLAASLANSHLIVIGDPLQLPPVCRVTGLPLVTKWLGKDVFTLGRFSLSEAATGNHHSVLLPDQNRMLPEISALICDIIYQGHLHNGTYLPRATALEPFPDNRVIVWDTSGILNNRAEQRRREGTESKSWYNECHAECAIQLAQIALTNFSAPVGRDKVGIITPYAAQAGHLHQRLRKERLDDVVRVGTVHSFQGLQCEIIIFDTVLTPGVRWSKFLLDRYMEQGEPTRATRLLNVAISRAQQKFCMVVHATYFRNEIQNYPGAKDYPLAQILALAVKERRVNLYETPKALFPSLPIWGPGSWP
jgi:hypothetical protein